VRYMPDRIMRLWPWVTRRRYETVKQENYTLRAALREANSEPRQHRVLISGLRAGDARMTAAVERAIRWRTKL
jgi:hypothetical protein